MSGYTFRTAEASVPVAERAAEMRDDFLHILNIKMISAEIAARLDYVARAHLVDHENEARRKWEVGE